ncbi:MAG: C39 family peptidase [Minisyncoccota bacterium]
MKKEVYTAHDTKLDVPYFSQYSDIEKAEYGVRACGMTCAYMVLKYFGAEVPTLEEVVDKGMREGGYSKSGWVHEYFVRLFQDFGYVCERREHMKDETTEDIRTAIKNGNPVIVSVVRRLWDQRLFHMVVLTGVRENVAGDLEGFFYHDPASVRKDGARHLYVPLPTFFLDWRHMAILPSRSSK